MLHLRFDEGGTRRIILPIVWEVTYVAAVQQATMKSPLIVLEEAYRGEHGALRGQIPPKFAAALAAHIREQRPMRCLEIGMAFGMSSLAILSGLPEGGTLTSIDPFQTEHFGALGRKLVEASSRAADHTLIEEPDFLAMPRLLAEGRHFDFIYIDGMHTFDYVALDAFYADMLVPVGGVVAFNDCGFRSIHKFLRFFRANRDYEEFGVGLEADYRGRNPVISIIRRIEGRSNEDRYFRKRSTWQPTHGFFKRF